MRAFAYRGVIALVVSGFLAACGQSSPADNRIDERVDIPAEPTSGFQFVLPEIEFAAHSERMMCWYKTVPSDVDTWMVASQSFQGENGHHLIAFLTFEDLPDGTMKDCTSPSSMAAWMPFIIPAGNDATQFPAGIAQKIPAGAHLVFQTHYVNTKDETIVTRDVVQITTDPNPTNVTPAAPWAVTTLDMALPPGVETTRNFDCTFGQDVQLFEIGGHMHDFGSHMEVYLGPPGAAPDKVYEVEQWEVDFRDYPPTVDYPVSDPFIIPAGDVLTTSCTWNNTSDEILLFPEEMCAMFGYYFPAEDTLICSNSSY